MKPVVGATVKQPWCEAKVVLIVVRGHVVKTCVPGLGGPVAGLNPKTVLCSGELAGGDLPDGHADARPGGKSLC